MNDQLLVQGADWTLALRWPRREGRTFVETVPSSVRVVAPGAFVVVLPDGQRLGGEEHLETSVPPLLWEPPRLAVSFERTHGGPPIELDHPDPRVRTAVVDPSGRGRSCSGALDLSERVGFLELGFRSGGTELIRVRVEVFPAKLSYEADFRAMLTELAARRPADAIGFLTKTYIRSGLTRRPNRSLAERFQIVESLFPRIERALAVIDAQPHQGLAPQREWRSLDRVRRPDARTLNAARTAARREERVGDLHLPRRLPDAHRGSTWDTPPNRYVRGALEGLVGMFRSAELQGGDWADPSLRERLASRRQQLRRWLARDYLRAASGGRAEPDLAMERSPGYRDFLRAWRMTLLGYSLMGGELAMDLADLDALYERWCEERLRGQLRGLLGEGVPEPGRVTRYPDGTVLRVHPRYRDPEGGQEHVPDFSVELTRPAPRAAGGLARFVFLFDAKYRLQWRKSGPDCVPDAVNAMHRYRDAIVSHDLDRPTRTVFGGAILFPHPDEASFETAAGNAWERVGRLGVGAIPLTPTTDGLFRRWLAELVHASAVRLDRLGPPYRPLPPPRRTGLVLLAHVPYGEAQVRQVRQERWLHVDARLDLAGRRPSHVALLEPAPSGFGHVRRLFPILDWREVSGGELRPRLWFGDGRAGMRPSHKLLALGEEELVEPPLDGSTWWPRNAVYVPLEVFDLADTTFLLRGDERHVALIRIIHHLRQLAARAHPGWLVREPIVVGGVQLGELQASASGVTWRLGGATGGCSLADVRERPVKALFEPLRGLGAPALT